MQHHRADSTHTHLDRAVAEMVGVLGPHAAENWDVPAGGLEWSCWTTAAHVAHDLLAYAGQLAARPADGYLPFDLTVRPETPPGAVLQVVGAAGALLSGALAAADPGARAWHWGPCDPEGFAAMGVAEVLLHTHDITAGLGVPWLPPAQPCTVVLHRLFPDAPPGDPVRVLLWCTGRGDLPGHPRRSSWTWQAAVPEADQPAPPD
ncbi:maleylpyruvate isomerase N-terminal domain-containing protein [Streptacidiphilus cavernicola]|uniref:Maleylpyruvate isomerase N-terminal domain-containing protein n=1 Tax=Streptacidiphilus cavernicola TaxID=3342716 RepID=A0ABV6VYU2_9ACTN